MVLAGTIHGFVDEDTRRAAENSTGRRDKKRNKKDTELGLPIFVGTDAIGDLTELILIRNW